MLELPFAAIGQSSESQRHLALTAQLIVQIPTKRGCAGTREIHALATDRFDQHLLQRRAVVKKDAIQGLARTIQRLEMFERHTEDGLGDGTRIVGIAVAPHLAIASKEESAVDKDGGAWHRESL